MRIWLWRPRKVPPLKSSVHHMWSEHKVRHDCVGMAFVPGAQLATNSGQSWFPLQHDPTRREHDHRCHMRRLSLRLPNCRNRWNAIPCPCIIGTDCTSSETTAKELGDDLIRSVGLNQSEQLDSIISRRAYSSRIDTAVFTLNLQHCEGEQHYIQW